MWPHIKYMVVLTVTSCYYSSPYGLVWQNNTSWWPAWLVWQNTLRHKTTHLSWYRAWPGMTSNTTSNSILTMMTWLARMGPGSGIGGHVDDVLEYIWWHEGWHTAHNARQSGYTWHGPGMRLASLVRLGCVCLLSVCLCTSRHIWK